MKVGDLVKAWSTVARVKVNDKTAESLKQFQMGIPDSLPSLLGQ